jgi:hypothetical protein
MLPGRFRAGWAGLVILTAMLPGRDAAGSPPPRTLPPAAHALTARGFENVVVSETPETVTVWYENRIYRYEMAGLGEAASLAASDLDSTRTLIMVPENRGVAIVAVAAAAGAWRRFLAGDADASWFRSRVRILADGEVPRPPSGAVRSNSRSWRTDLALRPLFSFELGIADDPFQYSAWLAPEAVMSPATGVLLTLQGEIRLHDDFDDFGRDVVPGRNTTSWGGRLPGGWLGAASAGIFPNHRYGVAARTGRLFENGAFEAQIGGDLSGFLKFSRHVVLYSPLETWSAFVAGTYRTPGIDLETTVTGARFMEKRLGGRLDVGRRFGETRVDFFGIKTKDASVVGMEIEVPLPVRQWSRPGAVRVRTVPTFPLTYRESVHDIGRQVSMFDDLERLRKGLYPTFILNNLEDLRSALPSGEGGR